MKRAWVYAGQGSQHVGMGKDFYEGSESFRKFIDSVEEIGHSNNCDFKKLMFEGPIEDLSKTENTQGCMAVFAAGVTRLLYEAGLKPDVTLGLSLGEYGAFHAAGVIDATDYIRITLYRGRVMMEAAKGLTPAMSAVLGLDSEIIEKCVEEYAAEHGSGDDSFVAATNYNCPGQTVICGCEGAVADLEEILKGKGAKRCVRLNVSGPFHTRYMKAAGDALRAYFKDIEFKSPDMPVLLNLTGDYCNEDTDIRENLVAQVQSPVRLEAALRRLLESGVEEIVEIGPGNTLSGFIKKTAKAMGLQVKVTSIDKYEDFCRLVEDSAV